MKRWLRHHRYALVIAFRRLLSSPFSTLANLLVIALILTLPIIGSAFLVAAQPVVKQVSIAPDITLFVDRTQDQEKAQSIATVIRSEYEADISNVRVVPKEQAMNSLKTNPSWSDALAVLPENPLPHAVVITLKETEDLPERVATLTKAWKSLDGVENVQHDAAWVQRLAAILAFLRVGLGLMAAGVVLVVLATIFNTVRMQALSQREEIAVARLVGATESFVRRPFLYLGALTGIFASIAAIVFAKLALAPMNENLATLAGTYNAQLELHLPGADYLFLAIFTVAILAALSAR
ncbi:MAG TPA: permease, partial [Pusillimonas sp.]|nr:permease [Pusillimonas sp.]